MYKKTSPRNFICIYPECSRAFKTRFSMKRHMLIHSQLKEYKCSYCEKEFALAQYLKEHIYTHTKVKPYVCGILGCNKAFRQAGKLSLHRRTHKEYILKQHDCQAVYVDKNNRSKKVKSKLKQKIPQLSKPIKIDRVGRRFIRQNSGQTINSINFKENSKEDIWEEKLPSDQFNDKFSQNLDDEKPEVDGLCEFLNQIQFIDIAETRIKLPVPFKAGWDVNNWAI